MVSSKEKYLAICNRIKNTLSNFDVDLEEIFEVLKIRRIKRFWLTPFRDYLEETIINAEKPPEFCYSSAPKEKNPKTFFEYFESDIDNLYLKLADYDKLICQIDNIRESVDLIVPKKLKKLGWLEGTRRFPNGGGCALFLRKQNNKIEAYSYVYNERIEEKYMCVKSNGNFESCLDLDGGEFESLNDLEEYFFEIDYPKEFKF
ncbi:MAG: hypothetical protein ABGW56_03245 [Flavobacteriaceae bacterium]